MNTSSNIKHEFYKRVYHHVLKIIKCVENLPANQSANIIGNQLIRSASSVAANLIEAKAASSKKDYINFYNHALKSANESKLWICLLRDTDKIGPKASDDLLQKTDEISKILASSILTMKGRKK
jgi:four helix bundle protein